jgi:hypothetical protein
MLKIVSTPIVKEIDVTEVMSKLLSNSDLILFYLSKDSKYPCFFDKKLEKGYLKYGFHSPIFQYTDFTYASDSMDGSIKEAVKNRQLYVITKEELANLFGGLIS